MKNTITAQSYDIHHKKNGRNNIYEIFSHVEVCEKQDIVDVLRSIRTTDYDQVCNAETIVEDLNLERPMSLASAIDTMFVEHSECSSQEIVELETHLTRLVRRVKPKFSSDKFEPKVICNTVRKSLPRLKYLIEGCG